MSATAAVADRDLSRRTETLFLAFAAYLAIPIIEVPVIGLSLSALLMYLIAQETLVRESRLELSAFSGWLWLAYLLGLGVLLSLFLNVASGDLPAIQRRDLVTVIRYGYWLLAFVLTLVIASRMNGVGRIATVLGLAILLLGATRLGEAVLFGAWGHWTRLRLLSQNDYGFLFSTFTPFALYLVAMSRRAARWFLVVALLMLFLAIIGNGSRSSWISVVGAGVVFLGIAGLAAGRTRTAVGLLVLVGAVGLGFMAAPQNLKAPIETRMRTLSEIDEDKSWAIRKLMVQKGLRIFEEDPVAGAGPGRFVTTDTELDIPLRLAYGSSEYFNRKSSHNSYVAFLAEMGLVGTVPYAALLLVLGFGGGWAATRMARRGDLSGVTVYAGFIGMSIHLWTVAALTGTSPWFMYGLLAAMTHRELRRRSEGDETDRVGSRTKLSARLHLSVAAESGGR